LPPAKPNVVGLHPQEGDGALGRTLKAGNARRAFLPAISIASVRAGFQATIASFAGPETLYQFSREFVAS
jgi:hypothetical protein